MAANTRADAWTAQQAEKTRAVRAAMARLIDDAPQHNPRRRTPNAIEQAATERPGDKYEPTTAGPAGNKPIADVDPTLAAVFKWEANVQHAATRIADAAEAIYRHASTASTRPKIDAPTIPPAVPPTRVTGSGRTVINVTSVKSAEYATLALAWIDLNTPKLADVIRHEQADANEPWQVSSILTKLAATLGVRLCRCDDNCGLPAPPYGKGRIRPACRQRNSRRQRKTKGTSG